MPQPTYQVVPFSPFVRGVDLFTTKGFVESGFVTKAKNITFDRGVAAQRKGYGRRSYTDGSNILPTTNAPLDDPVIGIARFWPVGGSEQEMVLTDKYAYNYSFATGAFTSLFNDSDGAGTDVQCFQGTSSAISWTIAPVNKATSIRPTFVFTDGVEYTDPATDEHTIYEWVSESVMEDSNPVNARAEGRIVMTDLTSFNYAKQIIWYGDHLIVADYSAGASRYRNGLAWGDFQVLSVATGGTDNAQVLLGDAKGYIQRLIRLGSHLVVYLNESIVICDKVPTSEIYAFDTRIQGTGLLGPRAVVDIGGAHIFIGRDNVYMYDGGLQVVPIGDKITDAMFSLINPDATDGIIGHHLPRLDKVIFYVPTANNDEADGSFEYNYRDRTWSGPGVLADKVTAVGFGTRTVAYRCSDAPFVTTPCNPGTTWNLADYANRPCSDFSHQAGFEVPTIGLSDGDYHDFSGVHFTDNGDAISSEFWTDSKPMGASYGQWGQAIEIRVESRGSLFRIEYSLNEGSTWTQIAGNFGGTTYFATETIPVNIIGKFLMLKVSYPPSGGSTEIKTILVRMRAIGSRGLDA